VLSAIEIISSHNSGFGVIVSSNIKNIRSMFYYESITSVKTNIKITIIYINLIKKVLCKKVFH